MDKQTILNKIRKLIALRNGARDIGSEGEANAAAAAIQRLLTEYNLSLADVDSAAPEEAEESPIGRSDHYNTADNYRSGWKRQLLYALCEYYYCRAYMIAGTPRCTVYGTEMNRMATEYAFNFLESTFSRLSVIRFKEEHGTCRTPTRHRDIWMASYLLGCASGVRERLMAFGRGHRDGKQQNIAKAIK